MEQQTSDKIREIKKSLRLAMNGVVSALQRRQGLNYKINFGVEIPRIKEIAAQYGKERQLASALWQEEIRECRMIAILTMPAEEFTAEDANEWIASARYTELADQLSMHLLCNIPNAVDNAIAWAGQKESIAAYCGFSTIAHLLRKQAVMNSEQTERYINVTAQALDDESGVSTVVKQRAYNTFSIFIDTAQPDEEKIKKHRKLKELFNI